MFPSIAYAGRLAGDTLGQLPQTETVLVAGGASQTNNCGASLAAGASCTIQVTFTPTAIGARPATLSVASGFASYTVNLSGNGTPAVTISASSNSVTAGNPVTLNWTATAGSSCMASGGVSGDGWTGNLAASGSQNVTESAAGQVTYGLTCAGGGQNAQAQVMVTVNAPTGGGGGGGGNSGGGGGGAFDLLSLLGLAGLASMKLRRKGFAGMVDRPIA